jgi:uncharacterized phage protein (TIGR02220 family)
MSINIDNLIKSKLDCTLYIILQLLYEGELDDLQKVIKRYDITFFDLHQIESEGYIQILGSEMSDIYILDKAKELFYNSKEDLVDEILTYWFINILNMSPNKAKLSIKSAQNRKFISGRLNEGYSKEDIIAVFNIKKAWKTDYKMKPYYRLATLLAPTNFQSYIQEIQNNTINSISDNTSMI